MLVFAPLLLLLLLLAVASARLVVAGVAVQLAVTPQLFEAPPLSFQAGRRALLTATIVTPRAPLPLPASAVLFARSAPPMPPPLPSPSNRASTPGPWSLLRRSSIFPAPLRPLLLTAASQPEGH